MSTWNRSYLEAMGVPVWGSRQAAVVDTVTEKAGVETQVEPKATFGYVSVVSNPQPKAYLLVTPEQDLQQVKSNFQSLSQAWKSWQSTELPLALLQLVELDDSAVKAESIDSLKDHPLLIATNQPNQFSDLNYEQVPGLDWQSASDKKTWWHLLQKLA